MDLPKVKKLITGRVDTKVCTPLFTCQVTFLLSKSFQNSTITVTYNFYK